MNSIKQTRLQIEKFVYEKGTNVALYNAEHSPEYQEFKTDMEKALFSQISAIATNETQLSSLLLLTKVAMPVEAQILSYLSLYALDTQVNIVLYLLAASNRGGQAFLDKNNFDGTFDLRNRDVINYFKDYTNLLVQGLDNTSMKWIATTIGEGKAAGLTLGEIKQKLIDEGRGISAIRAESIALTETAKAMNYTEMLAAMRIGVKEHIWWTSIDERVCPICSPLNGKRVAIGSDFGDGYFYPPAHTNCRCYDEQVIPDYFETPSRLWLGE